MDYRFTHDARLALASIVHFITLENENAARRINEHVFHTCETLAEMPGLGRHYEFVRDPEILCFLVKKYQQYLIFYRKRSRGITIVDIVHGARDLPNLFGDK